MLTLTQLRETVPDQVKDRLERTRRYTRRLGLARSDGQLTAGIFFVNGKAFPLDEVGQPAFYIYGNPVMTHDLPCIETELQSEYTAEHASSNAAYNATGLFWWS